MFSCTVALRQARLVGDVADRRRRRAALPLAMGMPSRSAAPAVGARAPAITAASVDLPDPVGPTMPSAWPGSSARLTARRAGDLRPGWKTVTFANCSAPRGAPSPAPMWGARRRRAARAGSGRRARRRCRTSTRRRGLRSARERARAGWPKQRARRASARRARRARRRSRRARSASQAAPCARTTARNWRACPGCSWLQPARD